MLNPLPLHRWRKGDEVVDGELWAHCVVCVMLWARGSNIKLSGCTGGTIKVRPSQQRYCLGY
jgi:hypothetical protein